MIFVCLFLVACQDFSDFSTMNMCYLCNFEIFFYNRNNIGGKSYKGILEEKARVKYRTQLPTLKHSVIYVGLSLLHTHSTRQGTGSECF